MSGLFSLTSFKMHFNFKKNPKHWHQVEDNLSIKGSTFQNTEPRSMQLALRVTEEIQLKGKGQYTS